MSSRSGVRRTRTNTILLLVVVLAIGALTAGAVIVGREAPSVTDSEQIPDRDRVIPLEGPRVVALQPGHWKIDELPPEHDGRDRGIGAVYGAVRELDINLAVVDALVPMLEERGWTVIVVPATVPPGLRADVFVSVHADWASDPNRRGWKLAPPWRPSPAARDLAESLRDAFAAREELREDAGGITVGMRGYFGFASHRYTHASSPYTPAVLVELGFVTNASDRRRMLDRPDYYARIIAEGIERHLYTWSRADTASLVPQTFETMVAGDTGGVVYRTRDRSGPVLRRLEPGDRVRPVDELEGWYEVRFWSPRGIGWVAAEELVPYDRLVRDERDEDERGRL